jgi:hypothetical protein
MFPLGGDMTRDRFEAALLSVMERKVDPKWGAFTSGRVPKERLHIHLEHEWDVYVRDFPVLVGRAYVQCPLPHVRRELAENLYEEETGGIAAGKPHPELFMEYPKGLGMDLARFDRVELLPGGREYRNFLDDATTRRGWEVATAVVTIFIEGTPYDRSVLDPSAPARPEPRFEDHPLVKHYGLPIESLALTKAHRAIEGEHRAAAWHVVLDVEPSRYPAVIAAMEEALVHWLAYRRDVAAACGV